MLMENTLREKQRGNLRYIFDLKGSLVNRKVKGRTTPSSTLKDVNFLLTSKQTKDFVRLDDCDKRHVRQALQKDVEFLRSEGIMDYSLLLGLEKKPQIRNVLQLHTLGAPRLSV